MPSRETIQSNEYPFSGTFYAITTGNETENTRRFIEWILSEEGQYLVERTGYIPIR
jgi:phosphate transport system substrate-binding protein